MNGDIIINKTETIKRCLARIKEEYVSYEDELENNYTKQDSIILNLERAAQASIDVSTHIIRIKQISIPKRSRDVCTLLKQHKIISSKTSEQMKKMVGFRNIAVHDYQNISLDIVKSIIENNLPDFECSSKEIINAR